MRLVIMLCAILFINGCGSKSDLDYHLDQNSFDSVSLNMIQKKTGLTFPAGSRGLYLFYQGSTIDPAFLAKIEIPENLYKSFTTQVEQLPNKRGDMMVDSLMSNVSWWKPSTDAIILERLFDHEMNGVKLIYCKEDNLWVVYIMWIKI